MNYVPLTIIEASYTETIKIFNCPFCAEIPDARIRVPAFGKPFLPHEIICMECDVVMRHFDAKTLVKKWNQRRVRVRGEVVQLDNSE